MLNKNNNIIRWKFFLQIQTWDIKYSHHLYKTIEVQAKNKESGQVIFFIKAIKRKTISIVEEIYIFRI